MTTDETHALDVFRSITRIWDKNTLAIDALKELKAAIQAFVQLDPEPLTAQDKEDVLACTSDLSSWIAALETVDNFMWEAG